jgi:2'-5' RNA ligase
MRKRPAKRDPKADHTLGYGHGTLPYCICLIFPPEQRQSLVRIAQMHYAAMAKNYCLSDKIIPHLTLCQFYANDIKALPTRLNEMRIPKYIKMAHGHIRRGRNEHEGFDWVEIAVEKDRALTTLKSKVDEVLDFFEMYKRTPGGIEYSPHITLARVSAGTKVAVPISVDGLIPCILALGRIDTNGQLLKIEWQPE